MCKIISLNGCNGDDIPALQRSETAEERGIGSAFVLKSGDNDDYIIVAFVSRSGCCLFSNMNFTTNDFSKVGANLTYIRNWPLHIWVFFVATVSNIMESIWLVLDTWLFYVINCMLLVLSFADAVLDFSDKVTQNFQIMSGIFKHQTYNNIN